MIREHLPALQVVVPLVAAPLATLVRRPLAAWGVALLATWTAFAIAMGLAMQVLTHGTISYPLGGWAAPWGIEYRVDALNAFLLVFVSGIGAVVLSGAPASVAHEIDGDRHVGFLTAYLLCLTGLLGICITGDLFNVFVFLEISALSSYLLIALGPSRRALTASFRYLILGTIGATFILIGIGLMYMMTGTLNMADAAARLAPVVNTRTVHAAFAFFSVGVALKMALFPLHFWLPDAYTHAPSAVSAFLAGTATKVAIYVFLRFVFSVYGVEFAFERMPLAHLLLPLALATALVCSAVAVYQDNLKQLLAWSSLAQIGYIMLGISLVSVAGLTGGIVHLFNHAIIKTAMFLAVGGVVLRRGSLQLRDLDGLATAMPWSCAAWVVGGLGLIGVPVTAGFISKWYLVGAALDAGNWFAVVLILLSSLLALAYVWRVVEAIYFREPSAETRALREAPLSMLVPTWLLLGASLFFGIYAEGTAGFAERAARGLLSGAP